MNRCKCSNATVCGELEAAVLKFAKAGQLPPFPIPAGAVDVAKLGIDAW
jgi:hypothetical protein